MDEGLLVGLIGTLTLTAAGVSVIFAALRYRTKMIELQHAERLAMIDKGLVPSPEMAEVEPGSAVRSPWRDRRGKSRSLSLGIIVVGLGLAIMCVVGIAGGAPESGLGIGGAVAILGGAFIARSLLVGDEVPPPPGTPGRPPSQF